MPRPAPSPAARGARLVGASRHLARRCVGGRSLHRQRTPTARGRPPRGWTVGKSKGGARPRRAAVPSSPSFPSAIPNRVPGDPHRRRLPLKCHQNDQVARWFRGGLWNGDPNAAGPCAWRRVIGTAPLKPEGAAGSGVRSRADGVPLSSRRPGRPVERKPPRRGVQCGCSNVAGMLRNAQRLGGPDAHAQRGRGPPLSRDGPAAGVTHVARES